MKKNYCLLLTLALPLMLTSCGIEEDTAKAVDWSLCKVALLLPKEANEAANLLNKECPVAIAYLKNPAVDRTVAKINQYLIDVLIKSLSPAAAAGIDTAAAILDNILPVDPMALLTTEEILILVEFVQGVQDGAQEYLKNPQVTVQSLKEKLKKVKSIQEKLAKKTVGNPKPRFWLHIVPIANKPEEKSK